MCASAAARGDIERRYSKRVCAVLLVTSAACAPAPPSAPAPGAAAPSRPLLTLTRPSSARPPVIQLDTALGEAAKARPFSGVALVAFGDRIIAQRSAGFADAAQARQITEQSRFVIGSLSKQITAALVLRAVEAGRIRLEDPIIRYLPLSVPATVQVRHLLNHTSGLQALDQPLAREPGTSFEYSNLGYDLLARIVEQTSGQPFAEAVKRLLATCGVFGAGMLDSNNESSLVVGFAESPEGRLTALPPPPELKQHPASGGLVASAGEFLTWTRCLQSGRAISPSSLRTMVTASTTRTHRWGVLGYGFGLQILESDGLLELSHSGYVPGFVSTSLIYPKQCVTVVILENIATPLSDLSRAFAPHDRIRAAVRVALRHFEPDEQGCTRAENSLQ